MDGYEPIVIDGIGCEVGWTNTDYGDCIEWHFAVLRHGCQIGKSPDREQAIAEAETRLRYPPSAWLREPCPEHLQPRP
jgi:hypothetical protein